MKARLALGVVVAGLSLGVVSAGAVLTADECRGLQVCLPVAGPWVVVPPGGVDYELACPIAGYVVAGIDARVAARDVDVSFRGETGSPVGPGVTTRRSIVFHSVRTRVGAGTTSFQPLIGCIPTSGGGGRALTGMAARPFGFEPVRSLRSVVVNDSVRSGSRTVKVGCPAGTRLVGSTHAVAFRRPLPPSPQVLGAVRVRRTVIEGVVVARVTTTSAVVQAEVQVRALCVGVR